MKNINPISCFAIFSYLLILHPGIETYAPCTPPSSGSWVITGNCELTSSVVIRGDVIVQNNSTLTIEAGVDINIDLSVNRIEVESGSHIILKNTGKIHTIMIDDTDGRVGYYLKEVNGPVRRALNENVSFYPASTIKVLQHVHALRQVQLGNANLTTSMLTVCPGNNTNCTNTANSNSTCGANTITESLSTALNMMMVPSDNQSTNAIQEFFGGGNAQTGRANITQTGQVTLGLSNQTVLNHKFNCGNISNNPFNTSTLADLAEIYEEIGEDQNILTGNPRNNFYSLMLNEGNDNGFINDINAIIDEENNGIGLSAFDISTFKNTLNTARKAGNVACCFSNAGWIELPHNNGLLTKQFVFAIFLDTFSTNNVDLNEVCAELLRKAIKEALESWT